MADDGLGMTDLAGRWVGFYRHRSERLGAFPITAEFRQEGDRITGEMYDQITDSSQPLGTIVEVHGEELSRWRRLLLEDRIRRYGDAEVFFDSHLPDTSDIAGRVAGDLVDFSKTYRGAAEVRWSVDGVAVSSATRMGHRVRYSGRLDREGGIITGEWTIPRRGLLGRILPPEARGTFELYRKA